jgi:hypothetical protein
MPLTSVRFSIGRMMACVGVAAIALALVRYSVLRWGTEGLTFLVFLAFCITGPLAPYFFKGRWAMFWAGFGGYGILYLSFTLGYFNLPFRLPTSYILDGIHERLPTNFPVNAIDFQRAGHAVFALLFGILAGFLLSTQISPKRAEASSRLTLRASFPSVFALWDRLRLGRRP